MMKNERKENIQYVEESLSSHYLRPHKRSFFNFWREQLIYDYIYVQLELNLPTTGAIDPTIS